MTKLLDAKQIMAEYGLSKETAYALMRKVGVIDLNDDGIRKLYVRREDLEAHLDGRTVRT